MAGRSRVAGISALILFIAACSNGRGSVGEAAPAQGGGNATLYSIAGTITGLIGTGLVLRNGSDQVSIDGNGAFAFPIRLASGASYNVTIGTQPDAPVQTCSIANGAGSIASSNINDVVVTCASGQFSVGGSVNGLIGTGLVLTNNDTDDLTVASNGNFTFAAQLPDGASYNVTVKTQPLGQSCVVRAASGRVSGADITNVAVSCASDAFSIGGSVAGLLGEGLTLRLNQTETLQVAASGSFAFETALPAGSGYQISVLEQPINPTQQCSVANGSGMVNGNVTSVAVTCTNTRHSVSGTVSGLVGFALELELNSGSELVIQANGTFTFPAQLSSGTPYRVTVARQPRDPDQRCTITNASGIVGGTNVTNVRVTCASQTYSIGGTVIGLLGSELILENNGDDVLRIVQNGSFVFSEELASGSTYNVTVRAQPDDPRQACTIARGRGTIESADVTSIAVSCTTSDFTVGGRVRDLEGTGLVLRNNGGDELILDSNGSFTFDTALPSGATYEVTIAEQPRDPRQLCSVSNGWGVVGNRNVTNISVRCSSDGYRVGGRVSKLRGSGLVLQNNGADDLAIGSNGSFSFASPLRSGAIYNVTVLTQPSNPRQTCSVMNSTGLITNSHIQNVEVRCRGGGDN